MTRSGWQKASAGSASTSHVCLLRCSAILGRAAMHRAWQCGLIVKSLMYGYGRSCTGMVLPSSNFAVSSTSESIENVINSGIVPKLVESLSRYKNPVVQVRIRCCPAALAPPTHVYLSRACSYLVSNMSMVSPRGAPHHSPWR